MEACLKRKERSLPKAQVALNPEMAKMETPWYPPIVLENFQLENFKKSMKFSSLIYF